MTNVRTIHVDWYNQRTPSFKGGPQLAYQGDHLSNMVVFDNAPELPNYYLLVEMKTDDEGPVVVLPEIQLEGPQWVIPNYYTQICQQITYQVCCKTGSGDYEHHSAKFHGTILPVLKHNGEPIDQSPMFDPYIDILDKRVDELIVASGDIQIDSELKSDSGNPVQNRVVKAAIDGLEDDVDAVNGRLDSVNASTDGVLTLSTFPVYAEWEIGSINGSTGQNTPTSYTNRLRTDFVDIRAFESVSIAVNEGYQLVWVLLDDQQTVLYGLDSWHGSGVGVSFDRAQNPTMTYVRLAFKTNDGETFTDTSAALENVSITASANIVNTVNRLCAENGIIGEQVSPQTLKVDKTEFTTEVGNFYNSGYVIKTSANTAYRRALVDITDISKGLLVIPYDNTDPENGKMYVSSTVTFDGVTENFLAQLTPTASSELKKAVGLQFIGGVWCVNITRLKKTYPTAKALLPYSAVRAWSTAYYYIPERKTLEWIKITDDNYGVTEPVVFWGDSMTRGATDSYNNPYPLQFSALSMLDVVNGGVGGESTSDILARQGAEPIIVAPFTIPADTSAVEVSIKANTGENLTILKTTSNTFWNVNPCFISGIEGLLSYSEEKYYFTRKTAGETVNVTRPVIVETYAMRELRENTTVFWTQNNNEYSTDVLLNAFDVFVRYIQTNKYILMSPTKGYGSAYAGLEATMTQRYGRKYINLREYLLAYGLSDLNITPTEQDLTDISQGVIPTSIKTDSVHFTTAAYGIVARLVYERGIELGYWS